MQLSKLTKSLYVGLIGILVFAAPNPSWAASAQFEVLKRAEISKPLLQAIYGSNYIPIVATGTPYTDVQPGDFNADWIEKLTVDIITEGCAAGLFCPEMVVTKEQLSKIILKAKHGSTYMPPSVTGGVFNDVLTSDFASNWIEALANQGITEGCDDNNFCPKQAVTQAGFKKILNKALGFVYSDGEDGNITGWEVFDNDPVGATITNVFDGVLGSNVIELSGMGTTNGYRLRDELTAGTFTNWDNTTATTLDMKINFDENFRVDVKVETLNGVRFMVYANFTAPASLNTSLYVWHNISDEYVNGTWQNLSRNLKRDIQSAESGNDLVEIDSIIIKGSGRVDDVVVSGNSVIPVIVLIGYNPLNLNINDTFTDLGATALDDVDGDLTASIVATDDVDTSTVGAYTVTYTVTDSVGNTGTTLRNVVVTDPAAPIIYFDGEDDSITGWSVSDNTPNGASITNVLDGMQGKVVELNGTGFGNAYRLRDELTVGAFTNWQNRTATIFDWTMNFASDVRVYVQIQTLYGERFMTYANFPVTPGIDTDLFIWHDISGDYTNGTWQSFSRNLIDDLQIAEPGNQLIQFDSFVVRGNGRIDDIQARGFHSYPELNRTDIIYKSQGLLGDNERMSYIDPENALMVTDDDKHRVYVLDLQTELVTRIIDHTEFSAFTNGVVGECTEDSNNNLIGFCDIEAITYDKANDEVYIFSGGLPGTLASFRLSRSAPGQDLEISDWRSISNDYSSATMINGQLYVGIIDSTSGQGKMVPYNWDTDVIGTPILTIGDEIIDYAYSDVDGILWVLTELDMLYKINFVSMSILEFYDMRVYDILDPRGVAIVGQKLYIGDGNDLQEGILKHAIHVFDLP